MCVRVIVRACSTNIGVFIPFLKRIDAENGRYGRLAGMLEWMHLTSVCVSSQQNQVTKWQLKYINNEGSTNSSLSFPPFLKSCHHFSSDDISKNQETAIARRPIDQAITRIKTVCSLHPHVSHFDRLKCKCWLLYLFQQTFKGPS